MIEEKIQEIRKKAMELSREGKLGGFAQEAGKFAMYRELGSNIIHFVAKCPYCGYEWEGEDEQEFPYKIKCPKCRRIVWESKKMPGMRRKRRKSKK